MRDAILRATGGMLAHHGGNPTLDEIAATFGVTRRTVQDYFTSSTAIENELIAHLDPEVPRYHVRHPG